MNAQLPINTIFFDRDGVINNVVIRDIGVSAPRVFSEFEILSEFENFHAATSALPLKRFVVSNQPDVSRNLLPAAELDKMTDELKARFAFDEVMYCTHDNHHECSCRKPKSGMITHLLQKYNLDSKRCILIGDSYKDVLAGQGAGVTTILVRRDYNPNQQCRPEFIVDNLREVLNIITFEQG